MELLIAAVVGGVLLALEILWIIWRAVGAAYDWIIYTFGNEQAVKRLRAERDAKRRSRRGR